MFWQQRQVNRFILNISILKNDGSFIRWRIVQFDVYMFNSLNINFLNESPLVKVDKKVGK